MSNIVLKNILLHDEKKDIVIKGNLIDSILDGGTFVPSPEEKYEIVDCNYKAAAPGFVNMHTHAAMTLLRGEGKGMAFFDWLQRIWAIEAKLDYEAVYYGTKVACLEMLRTGTTTFNDHYWFPEAGQMAAQEVGLRRSIAYVILDNFDKEVAERQKEECQMAYLDSKTWGKNSTFVVGAHAPYTVSDGMLVWANEFAKSHDLKLHIHVSETQKEVADCKAAHGGLTPVEYLDSLGLLSPNLIAAHTLWLTEHDIELLGKNHVNCVHNINSNTKLSSGYKFLRKELSDAGANICIGTDGCASSNNLDMLEALKTTALFQKAWREDPQSMPIETLLEMGTLNGGKALGLNIGEIAPGRIADINIVDMNNSFFLSNALFISNYIYSAHADCIESVIIDGKFVMRNKKIEGEEEIISKTREILTRLK